jgi:CRISPR-associated exonuclease Cas4
MAWAALLAALAVAVLVVIAIVRLRQARGLGWGHTLALDDQTLVSYRYGLAGRPDRLIRAAGTIIPEEWKSSQRVWPSHRAQIGVYFVLIEDQLGVRPPHGFIVCGDGTRHRIENTAELRDWVLDLAERIREARRSVDVPIRVNPRPGQCRPCGMRGHCGQARA